MKHFFDSNIKLRLVSKLPVFIRYQRKPLTSFSMHSFKRAAIGAATLAPEQSYVLGHLQRNTFDTLLTYAHPRNGPYRRQKSARFALQYSRNRNGITA